MNGFTVVFARAARKELERLPRRVVQRVMRAITGLQADSRPRASRKLTGADATYRLRVGQYRVVYELNEQQRSIVVTRVRHRKDAYQ